MGRRQRAHLRVFLAGAIATLAATTTTAAPPFTVLHTFAGTDGADPYAPLIQATDGNFYGTTLSGPGGGFSHGTVFRMTPAGTVTILHNFGFTDGSLPYAALIQATDGNFYGTTLSGGATSLGTVFRITPDGTLTVLHVFTGVADGADPATALIQATDGNFYGTTNDGGGCGIGLGCGTVFKMTPAGTVTILHAFSGGLDGSGPGAALIQASDGNLYGMTGRGGASGRGTVFRMTLGGTLTILHAFAGGTDGANPAAALIQANDGNFYGTTLRGGGVLNCSVVGGFSPVDCGTVFKMTPAGTVTILHAFAGGADGGAPDAPVIQATDGTLYGSTASRVSFEPHDGTIFRMTPDGTVATLHTFRDRRRAGPRTSLISVPARLCVLFVLAQGRF